MTQENKELLLRDLCARLPYGVMCDIGLDHPLPLQRIFVDRLDGILLDFYEDGKNYQVYLSEVKPYLFPLESMTEEQKKELEDMDWSFDDSVINNIIECLGNHRQFVTHFDCFTLIEWCYKNHLDINGLIPIGTAIDATNLNIY